MCSLSAVVQTPPPWEPTRHPCISPSTPQAQWVCSPPPYTCGMPMDLGCLICALLSLANKLHQKTRIRVSFPTAPLQSVQMGIEACLYVYTYPQISDVFYSHLQFFSFATMHTVHTVYAPSTTHLQHP